MQLTLLLPGSTSYHERKYRARSLAMDSVLSVRCALIIDEPAQEHACIFVAGVFCPSALVCLHCTLPSLQRPAFKRDLGSIGKLLDNGTHRSSNTHLELTVET